MQTTHISYRSRAELSIPYQICVPPVQLFVIGRERAQKNPKKSKKFEKGY